MNEYDIEKAFKVIEDELVKSMIRNFDRHRAEELKEGYNWTAWQAEQLKGLEEYKRRNIKKYQGTFGKINSSVESLIRVARETGGASQELGILKAIKNGFKVTKALKGSTQTNAEFFKVNDRKLDALIKATVKDMEKAEHAVLRRANDQYRKIIFNAQTYANTGAGTYEKAVDMATKDFLQAGINCIEYSNGARHTIENYARMAIKTANKRAYLIGEGEKREEWGIHTVIINKRNNACPLCAPFVGKILIDDVYSCGSKKDGPYPLLSTAMEAGFLHPNCKDIFTTYFPGISTPPEEVTREEIEKAKEDYSNEQKQNYCSNMVKRYRRMSENSLDEENRRKYATRAEEWEEKLYQKNVEDSGIIKPTTNTKEVINVHSVGKIDKDIYKSITQDIVTDEVIITDRQIQHIKDRHPNDYERYQKYFKDIVEKPDYIIRANKPNTALVLKEIKENGEVFKTVVRLATSTDNQEYKNSIITFMKIDEREWNRLLRNKEILYKSE